MSDTSFSREPLDHGFTAVPHGLWTLALPMGCRVFLGWLHSHEDSFLGRLTINNCREAMQTSQIGEWLDKLEAAGFLAVSKNEGRGKKRSILLRAAPWMALFGPRQVSRDRPTNRAEIGLPSEPRSAYREEQGEEQENTNLVQPPVEPEPDPPRFSEFWAIYPKREGRKDAITAWKKIRKRDIDKVLEGAQRRVDDWRSLATQRQYMPLPASWLNGKRWNDEIEPITTAQSRSRPETSVFLSAARLWMQDKLSVENFTKWMPHVEQAWEKGRRFGYSEAGLAARLAIWTRVTRQSPNGFSIINDNVLVDLPNSPIKAYVSQLAPNELMDAAFEKGSWR